MEAMKDVENMMVSMIQMIAPISLLPPENHPDAVMNQETPRGNQGHYTSYYDDGHETYR